MVTFKKCCRIQGFDLQKLKKLKKSGPPQIQDLLAGWPDWVARDLGQGQNFFILKIFNSFKSKPCVLQHFLNVTI